jgi:hypothetical protein
VQAAWVPRDPQRARRLAAEYARRIVIVERDQVIASDGVGRDLLDEAAEVPRGLAEDNRGADEFHGRATALSAHPVEMPDFEVVGLQSYSRSRQEL